MNVNINSFFEDYELIDCGKGEKLERFGNIFLIRPDISAKNNPFLSMKEWEKMANAHFIEINKNFGEWNFYKKIDNSFSVKYQKNLININCNLFFSTSKHIGIFPEQVLNWNFLNDYYTNKKKIETLNLFAYSGSTSLALSPFSNQVTHVDSIKKIVDHSKINAALSGIENIRFIVEHVMNFVEKETKRKKKYSCVVLDPPPIGVGTKGEKWVFSIMIEALLNNINLILEKHSLILMNFYLQSFSKERIITICKEIFPKHKILFSDKVYGLSRYSNTIDHGFFIRLES